MFSVAYLTIASKVAGYVEESTLTEVINETDLASCLPEEAPLRSLSITSELYTTGNPLLVEMLFDKAYGNYCEGNSSIGEIWIDYEELKLVYDLALEILDETDPALLGKLAKTEPFGHANNLWCGPRDYERNMTELSEFVDILTPLMTNWKSNIEIILDML